MDSIIILYFLIGFCSYWPAVYFLIEPETIFEGDWYHWLAAWSLWCLTWPYWNAMNAWYWWRATK